MDANDMILVSVDDHLCEPPHMFDEHLPAKWRDEAPKLIRTPEGNDVWTFNGAVIPNVGLNAVAGRPKEEYGIEPTSLEEMRKGCYDIHERIKDMNAGGVLGSMCFPSFPGFAGAVVRHASRQGVRGGPHPGVQRLAHPRVVRCVPRSVHPDGTADDLVGRGVRRRSASRRRAGVPLDDVHREPRAARPAELPHRLLGSAVRGARRVRHGVVDPSRFVGSARRDCA